MKKNLGTWSIKNVFQLIGTLESIELETTVLKVFVTLEVKVLLMLKTATSSKKTSVTLNQILALVKVGEGVWMKQLERKICDKNLLLKVSFLFLCS